MKGGNVMNITCPNCGAFIKERYTELTILGTVGTARVYCYNCCVESQFPITQKETEEMRADFFLEPTVPYDD